MSRLRRQRRLLRVFSLLLCAVIAAAGLLLPVGHAATTEQVVTDRHSGLAIYGFDPVAYFTDRAALVGRPDLELHAQGVTWRFCNEGNLAAFADAPDVYMPRFGGYDPVALGRGITRAGHPKIWAIHAQRLFLFYSDEAKRAFLAEPERLLAEAEGAWPQISRALVP